MYFVSSQSSEIKEDNKTNIKKRHKRNKNDDEVNFFKSRYGMRRKTILEINRFFPEEFLN